MATGSSIKPINTLRHGIFVSRLIYLVDVKRGTDQANESNAKVERQTSICNERVNKVALFQPIVHVPTYLRLFSNSE